METSEEAQEMLDRLCMISCKAAHDQLSPSVSFPVLVATSILAWKDDHWHTLSAAVAQDKRGADDPGVTAQEAAAAVVGSGVSPVNLPPPVAPPPEQANPEAGVGYTVAQVQRDVVQSLAGCIAPRHLRLTCVIELDDGQQGAFKVTGVAHAGSKGNGPPPAAGRAALVETLQAAIDYLQKLPVTVAGNDVRH